MKRGRLWRILASPGTIAVVVVMLVVVLAPSLSFIEFRAYDVLFQSLPRRTLDPRVVVVDLGEDPSVYDGDRVCPPPPEGCEIPRRVYAKAARKLSAWGAKAVVFDLMFARPCPFEDAELAKAFKEAGNVIVAATAKVKPGAVSLEPPIAPLGPAVWAAGSPVAHQPNETVRSMPLIMCDQTSGQEYSALSLLAFQRFKGSEPSEVKLSEGRSLVTAGSTVPLATGEQIHLLAQAGKAPEESGAGVAAGVTVVRGGNARRVRQQETWDAMLINWSGPKGTIKPLLLTDVSAMNDQDGQATFGGKAVIIGRRSWDEHWTAVGSMPGPEIQANALSTLISGDFIRPLNPWGFLALLAALGATTSLVVRRVRALHAALIVALLITLVFGIARELLRRQSIWLYVFQADIGILLAWGVTMTAQSGKVAGLLQRFLPGFAAGIGGMRTQDATIVYSDIRSYTTISEQVGPEGMLRLLTPYRLAIEGIIKRHGGDIGITPGDAILAVFWRDFRKINHATCAVRAAREMLAAIPSLAEVWEAAGASLEVGVGVNSGPVAIGHVGEQRLEATVIGDAVNVAQRLETLTKDLGYPLIFSESVALRLMEDVGAIDLGEVTVKGRQEPIRVHGVIGPESAGLMPEGGADRAGKEDSNEG